MTHVQAHVSRSTAVAALLQAPAGRTPKLCALLLPPRILATQVAGSVRRHADASCRRSA
jgi:hypothetical protein